MALEPRNLKTDFDANAPWGKYLYPHADGRVTKTLALDAGITGTQVLPNGLPLAFESVLAQWVPWDPAGINGANVIRGFIDTPIEAQRTQSQTGEKKVLVLIRGVVNKAGIPLVSPTPLEDYTLTYNEAQLDAELKTAALRDAGITVTGLDEVG